MNIEQTMFALLRSEVCGYKLNESKNSELSFEVRAKLFILSAKHDLSHIIASALSKIEISEKDEITELFRKNLIMSVYRDEQKSYALKQACDVLEQAEIPHIPLKGSVIRDFYPQSWMRTSCDIDILIHPEDCDHAISKLCEAGFVRAQDASTHDYSLMSQNGVHVELHYTLTQGRGFSETDNLLKEVWNYAVPVGEGKYRYSLTNEIFILYHIAHMARHFVHGGCGIRSFIDLWIIKNNMPYDNEKLIQLLTEVKLLDFYEGALALSNVWLDGKTHTLVTKKMETFVLTGGSYGTTANSAAIRAAKGEGKVSFFIKLMFLPRENLAVLYPRLRKYPYLFPFYQIKRWFRIFNKDKRKKIGCFTTVRNSVTYDEAEETIKLLKSLGLD